MVAELLRICCRSADFLPGAPWPQGRAWGAHPLLDWIDRWPFPLGSCCCLAWMGAGRVPMAVLFVDIDQFKHINDAYGHAGGDCELKTMVQRINKALRKRDWAARIGGDEMLVVLYGLNDLGKAMAIGEKLLLAAHQPIDFGAQSIKPSINMAVTLATSAESVDSIIARVDQAMYLAKRHGRDQIMTVPV